MEHSDLLLELGLTDPQLHEFLKKYKKFRAELDEDQRKMLDRAHPTVAAVLKAFGPEVTADDLLKLFGGDREHPPLFVAPPLGQGPC